MNVNRELGNVTVLEEDMPEEIKGDVLANEEQEGDLRGAVEGSRNR